MSAKVVYPVQPNISLAVLPSFIEIWCLTYTSLQCTGV
jgi:hypothetical protein